WIEDLTEALGHVEEAHPMTALVGRDVRHLVRAAVEEVERAPAGALADARSVDDGTALHRAAEARGPGNRSVDARDVEGLIAARLHDVVDQEEVEGIPRLREREHLVEIVAGFRLGGVDAGRVLRLRPVLDVVEGDCAQTKAGATV